MTNLPRHLLSIRELNREQLLLLLNNGEQFIEVLDRDIKKVPPLRGKTIINLFLEPSTRTRTSFEIAAKRLSADAVNVSESGSSMSKGETLLDTVRTLEAMRPDILVVRHRESGAAHFIARHLTDTAVVNAGDGMHEHPTQALLDCLTLEVALREKSDSSAHQPLANGGRTIAIVGDVRHSRVARSTLWAHYLLGNKVRLVGPATLVPQEFSEIEPLRDTVSIHHRLEQGIEGADVVVCLRLQLERQSQGFIPSLEQYCMDYCITEARLRRYAPNSLVLHPGPMNRGTEISSEVAEGPRSQIERQVKLGVAVRMAVLLAFANQDRFDGSVPRSAPVDSEAR